MQSSRTPGGLWTPVWETLLWSIVLLNQVCADRQGSSQGSLRVNRKLNLSFSAASYDIFSVPYNIIHP